MQDQINQVFATLEEAEVGMKLIREYLNTNTYIDINSHLVPAGTLVEWSIVESMEQQNQKLSSFH